MNNNKNNFGCYEDLIAELDFKLKELLSHIKFLANSTGFDRDFDVTLEDVNAIAMTLHDKTLNTIFIAKKLRLALENIDI